ncbi:MAG: transglycosylase domain-containing protein [Oscillospiraceae bacterium]|nr:transglycosylase domain-containing protein [Oscillospiraceae bacterium]
MEKAKKVLSLTLGGLQFTAGGIAKVLLTLLLIILLTGVLFMCIFAYYVKSTLTDDIDLSLEDFNVNESSSILYQDKATGEWKELCMIQSDEKRIWIDYEQMPQNMLDAIVAIEDKRFYEHKGVDWYRTSAAMVNMFITMRNDFGGSTITQQLIKNLTKQDDITVQRKLLEIFQALEFEKTYDKKEILEWYLNVVYFGEGCYGIEAAAQTYYGKSASEMTLAECAALAGVTNNPSRYDPFISRANNKERQEIILYEMYHESGFITKEEYEAAKAEELHFVRSEASEFEQYIYSYYEEVVYEDVINDLMEQKGINEKTAKSLLLYGGYQIYSCIDMDIQNILDSYYTDLNKLPKPWRNKDIHFQSAMVIMNPFNGEIVALTGGTGEKTINFGLNRATNAYRSPGSSIKPLASYGPAMEYGLITPSTQVNDDAEIRLRGTSWYPFNYDRQNYGWTTIRGALCNSFNTVPAQIVDLLTPQVCYEFLTNRLGFTSLVPGDADYAAMALGQLNHGTTVREMTQAFGAFINDGTFTYGRTYSKVTDLDGNLILQNEPETIQAFNPVVADNMVSMLRSAVTSGTGGEASIGSMPVAGKTGTTTANKDRYFVGFTPY